MVITGTIPIHLQAVERAEVEQARRGGRDTAAEKKEARRRTLNKWQTEWDRSTTGRWTYNLIPCIDTWISRSGGR